MKAKTVYQQCKYDN